MSHDAAQKTCLILLGMGGPDTVDDVGDFLFNIFSDRSIIKLPGGKLLQKPLAKFISAMRLRKVQSNYNKIGGGSPLLKWTQAQRDNIEFNLAPIIPGFQCYIGMRYFKPYINDAIDQAYSEGFRDFVFLPLYPQYCRATTGSSFEAAGKNIAKFPDVTAQYINDFYDNKNYIRLVSEYINKNIKDYETLLFSAHSIPQKFVDEGDPYIEQVKQTAKLAAGNRDYHLAFQSRTGPVKWVEPDTVAEIKRLLDVNKKLFIVPISFVCDHIETLYELDIELKETLGSVIDNRVRRMPMFNDDKDFGSVLSEIFLEKVRHNGN